MINHATSGPQAGGRVWLPSLLAAVLVLTTGCALFGQTGTNLDELLGERAVDPGVELELPDGLEDDPPTLGDPEAPIVVVEYSDFA